MRVIAEYRDSAHPPLLGFYIFGAPHRRMCDEVILEYRGALVAACRKIGLNTPIRQPVDLRATFIDPTSPDLDNLIVALFRALDGDTFNTPGVLADDGLIQHVSIGKLFPHAKKLSHGIPPRRAPSLAHVA